MIAVLKCQNVNTFWKTNWLFIIVGFQTMREFCTHFTALVSWPVPPQKILCDSHNFLKPYLGFRGAECSLSALEREVVLNIAASVLENDELKELYLWYHCVIIPGTVRLFCSLSSRIYLTLSKVNEKKNAGPLHSFLLSLLVESVAVGSINMSDYSQSYIALA